MPHEKVKRLSDQEIAQLVVKAQKGDLEARNRIIESFVPLIRYIARKFSTDRSIEEDDLVSYGAMGLMQAIETFDPNRGIKLQTHATNRIRGEIKDSFRREENASLGNNRSTRSKVNRWESAENRLRAELGREPFSDEIEEAAKIAHQSYLQAKSNATREIVHADHPNGGGLNGHKNRKGWDTLDLGFRHNDFDDVDNKDFIYGLMEAAGLTQEERGTIELVYGLREATDEEWERIESGHSNATGTYRRPFPKYRTCLSCLDIGYILGVCESRVCQLGKRVLGKMQAALERVESPNRRILSLYLDDLREKANREPEILDEPYSPHILSANQLRQEQVMPSTIIDIKPDDDNAHKRKPVQKQLRSDGIYMVRIEDSGDSYFDTEQEVEDYVRDLFLYVGVQADKVHIYRKLDKVFTGKVELIPV